MIFFLIIYLLAVNVKTDARATDFPSTKIRANISKAFPLFQTAFVQKHLMHQCLMHLFIHMIRICNIYLL